jgi:hypothetical protein
VNILGANISATGANRTFIGNVRDNSVNVAKNRLLMYEPGSYELSYDSGFTISGESLYIDAPSVRLNGGDQSLMTPMSIYGTSTSSNPLMSLYSPALTNGTGTFSSSNIRLEKGANFGGSVGGFIHQDTGSGVVLNSIDNTRSIGFYVYKNTVLIDASTNPNPQPSYMLYVNGTFGSSLKTFNIPHPLSSNEKKRLIHVSVESPRCDLMYRGTVRLVDGKATVNIDKSCTETPECSMTEGTFEALTRNPVKYLHNNDSFDRVRGSINGNILTIVCENPNSTDSIDWQVIAERKDENVVNIPNTTNEGYLITEYMND